MQSMLFISPMTLGKETEVRELHEAFPFEALAAGNAIETIGAYIGSGFYALQVAFSDGDFQARFREFVSAPEVQHFFDQLRGYVTDLPAEDDQTAEVPLAAPLFYRERGMAS